MLYTSGKTLLGVKGGNKTAIALPYIHARVQSNYKPARYQDGYGFKDGTIKGPTSNATTNSTQYQQSDEFNGWSVLSGALPLVSGTPLETNYYLTSDITIDASAFLDESYVFAGILDGCGHTITINADQSGSWGSAHAFGTLIGSLTGTIKNVKIVTNFHWANSNSNGANQYVGGIAARIIGGTLENVYVQIGYASGQSISMEYSARPQSNALKMVGGICGEFGDSSVQTPPTNSISITNVTVQIDHIGWKNTGTGSLGFYPDVKFGVAGYAGHVAKNTTVTLKNVSVRGSGNLYSQTRDGKGGGKSKAHKGAFVGYSEGTLTFENVKYTWTGNTLNYDYSSGDVFTLDNNYEAAMIGAFDPSNTLTILNMYYSTNSYAAINGYLEYKDTQTALFGQQFADSLADYLGFLGNDLWIGDITQPTLRTMGILLSSIQGKYLDSIVFNDSSETEVDLTEFTAKPSLIPDRNNNNAKYVYIVKIATTVLQSMTNVLTKIQYGYFGYLSNEAGSSANSFKLYYNNGSYTDHSMPQGFNGRVSVYDVNERMTKVVNNENIKLYVTKNTNVGYYTVS